MRLPVTELCPNKVAQSEAAMPVEMAFAFTKKRTSEAVTVGQTNRNIS
jgi:hypothetical protein